MSASSALSCAHRCDDAHSAHGHHHHEVAPPVTPGHFLTRNPCDADGFSEVCACCQGAVDVDEFMGLKAAAPHDHSQMKLHLPTGKEGWAIAAATAWATLPGIYFGVQNYRAAAANERILGLAEGALRTEGLTKVEHASTQGGRDVRANWAAYAHTLRQSRSMQRFISVFAGALPALGSACMLGSVVAPALGAVGGGFLLVYCLSHITRYMTYEWPRVRALQAQLAAAPAAGASDDTAIALGLAASQQLLQRRQSLYPQAAAAFGVYAAGATLLTLGVAVPVGAGLLAVGLGAVLYLNNGPIKASYGKNADRAINRLALGSQSDLLRRIGGLQEELQLLLDLGRRVQAMPKKAKFPKPLLQLRLTRAVRLGLSYGLVFGICNWGRDTALTRVRKAEMQQLQEPHKLLAAHQQAVGATQPSRGQGGSLDALYQLLYKRPDEATHQLGALLDHFHARVAIEGLNLGHS